MFREVPISWATARMVSGEIPQTGVPHVEREVNALVKIYGTGAFAHRFFELDEELPEICSAAPWERKRK